MAQDRAPRWLTWTVAVLVIVWVAAWGFLVPMLVASMLGVKEWAPLSGLGLAIGGPLAIVGMKRLNAWTGRRYNVPEPKPKPDPVGHLLAGSVTANVTRFDAAIARTKRMRDAATGAAVTGAVAGLGAVYVTATGSSNAFLERLGVAGLAVLIASVAVDRIGLQTRIALLRVNKLRHLVNTGQIGLPAAMSEKVAQQRRLLQWHRAFWYASAVLAIVVVVDLVTDAIGIWAGDGDAILLVFGVGLVAYFVELLTVWRRIKWAALLPDVTDIQDTAKRLISVYSG
jgi:hypothetical protein